MKQANLKSSFSLVGIFLFVFLTSFSAKAWGPKGHAIVGNIAMKFVKDDVRKNVLAMLGNMPMDTAANWMDIMKSNQDYEFMRPWHYIDFPKEQAYKNTNEENIVNRLTLTFNELKHKKTLCNEQVKTDLLVLLHLMGDLHMPLHTGYDDDLGGNKIIVQYDTLKTHNLHWFWDEDIINLKNISIDDCLKWEKEISKEKTNTHNGVDFVGWMKDSRSLLPGVYDFDGFQLSDEYLLKNKEVVEKQLLVAGLRLAFLLNNVFYSPAPQIDYEAVTGRYKNGIDVKNVGQNLGKNVTVCSKVYGVKYSPAITRINLGSPFPNSPLSIVIFAKDYAKFNITSDDETFAEKNICVKGTIEQYQGKFQIVAAEAADISIL